ncbi:MAG: DNA gyrase subunit A, partial [Rhodobacterales bacterium CG15_BIG_FIL_POST_REV_8_21_14_020_59_13]
VISMAVLHHVEVTTEEARAYLKHAAAMRRAVSGAEDGDDIEDVSLEAEGEDAALSSERIAGLGGAEEFVLTVANDGFGKRSSAYEYRVMNRGGQGVAAHDLSRGVPLAASFTVEDADQIMAVTDGGQLIRFPLDTVRIAGRATKGVTLLKPRAGESVVSVVRIAESGEDEVDEVENPDDAGPAEEGDTGE